MKYLVISDNKEIESEEFYSSRAVSIVGNHAISVSDTRTVIYFKNRFIVNKTHGIDTYNIRPVL